MDITDEPFFDEMMTTLSTVATEINNGEYSLFDYEDQLDMSESWPEYSRICDTVIILLQTGTEDDYDRAVTLLSIAHQSRQQRFLLDKPKRVSDIAKRMIADWEKRGILSKEIEVPKIH